MSKKYFGSEVNRVMQIQESFPKKNLVKLEDKLNELEAQRFMERGSSMTVQWNDTLSQHTKDKLDALLENIKLVKLKYNLEGI